MRIQQHPPIIQLFTIFKIWHHSVNYLRLPFWDIEKIRGLKKQPTDNRRNPLCRKIPLLGWRVVGQNVSGHVELVPRVSEDILGPRTSALH